MTKLILNDEIIASLITEVAPRVVSLTGWELDLPSLRSRVLPKNRGYEEILLGRLEQLGMHDWDDLLPDAFERLLEYMIEANVLAAYMPGAEEILIVRENLDDSNLDGLKLVLGHELVHRGQHRTHPELFERLDHYLREIILEIQSQSTDFDLLHLAFEQVQPIMTILESHASYVQALLQQTYYPAGKIETPFNLARLLMRLVGGPKLAQYTDGLSQINAAYQAGDIERLYRSI